MKELEMYRCETCGNLICMLEDSGVIPSCCGSPMTHLIANTVDAAVEKHVPVVLRDGTKVRVTVGKLPHPMTLEHHISRVYLLTDKGVYVRCISPGEAPEAVFDVGPDEKIHTVYAWCTLHGLWKAEGTD